MAKKQETGKELKELKVKIQEKKVLIGLDRVLKALRSKTIKKVFLASNCPEKMKKEIDYYANLAEVPVLSLDLDNEEFGLFCKKNFFVTVLGSIEE